MRLLSSRPIADGEESLPLYRKPGNAASDPCSDEDSDYQSSDDEGFATSSTSESSSSSRLKFDCPPHRSPVRPRPRPALVRGGPRVVYPYRLPPRISRYVFFGLVGFMALMMLSLLRASQVENWKLANGKVKSRPAPPPIWESFPFLERYYGGIRTLKPPGESKPEYPSSGESPPSPPPGAGVRKRRTRGRGRHGKVVPSKSWEKHPAKSKTPGIRECFLDAAGEVRVPPLRYYEGRPQGFPQNVIGSYKVLGLPEDICFERFGRWGPYGFGYSIRSGGLGVGEFGEKEGANAVWEDVPRVDFRHVDWADAQRRCFRANAGLYKELPSRGPERHGFYISEGASSDGRAGAQKESDKEEAKKEDAGASRRNETSEGRTSKENGKRARTAVVLRCWDEFLFRAEDVANLRSLIAELSLASGGRYDVHLLVQVKNDGRHPIWADDEAYAQRIRDSIPQEFRGLVTLWTETQMLSLYQGVYDLWTSGPQLPVHGVYRGLSMAMQHFAYTHPEYDFYWQWEMDVRYSGHYLDLVTKLEDWAKAQPRKGLWERNARFYLPAVHGSWEDFSHMSRVQSEMSLPGPEQGASMARVDGVAGLETVKEKAIWGPQRPADEKDWFESDKDPVPPTSHGQDRYQWGVGEEADYISLNPIFDPEGTSWKLGEDITGFNRTQGGPPRRASIITTSRLSRRLLLTMHRATAYKKQFAFPEMWAATVALQHGYKAVFAPHPVYVDRRWPVDFLGRTLNRGRRGASGGSRASVFGEGEGNLYGLSWFYNSGFAPNLYRRWLGLKVNNDGGDEFERTRDGSKTGPGVGNMAGGEGRICLPPMLLHPVKGVELPVEAPATEVEGERGEEREAAALDPSA